MTDESSDTPSNHVPGKNGGRLRRGGTNKGGTGRPSTALRIRLDAIAKKFVESADSLKVAGNPKHKDYAKIGMWAVEMREGKPNQKIDAEVKGAITVTHGLGLKTEP